MIAMDTTCPHEGIEHWPDRAVADPQGREDPRVGYGTLEMVARRGEIDAAAEAARPRTSAEGPDHLEVHCPLDVPQGGDPGTVPGIRIYGPLDPQLVRQADDPDMIKVMAAASLAGRDAKTLKGWEGRRINRYRVLSGGREARRYSRVEILLVAATLPGWSPPAEVATAPPEAGGDGDPRLGEAADPVRAMPDRAARLGPALRVQVLATMLKIGELGELAGRLVLEVEQLRAQFAELGSVAEADALDRAELRARIRALAAVVDGEA